MTLEQLEQAYVKLAGAVDRLQERMSALERQLAQHAPVLNEHDDRLDELDAVVGELRKAVGAIQAELGRLANEATVTRGALLVVDRNVKRLLEIAEAGAGKTVVVSG